jgi:ABC-type Na+ efflux pump permease subunit
MKTGSTQLWFGKLAGQFAMGATLGIFLATYLIVSDTQRLFQMIINSSAPKLTMTVVVGVLALSFAVGATLTSWIFLMEDEAGQR